MIQIAKSQISTFSIRGFGLQDFSVACTCTQNPEERKGKPGCETGKGFHAFRNATTWPLFSQSVFFALTLQSLFFRFPCFFRFATLLFLCIFPSFSKDFRVSAKRKTLAFFGKSPCFFQKSKGWRVRVVGHYSLLGLSSLPKTDRACMHCFADVKVTLIFGRA